MLKKNLTKEQVEETILKLRQGKTKDELMLELGMDINTFNRIAKEFDIDFKKYRCIKPKEKQWKERPDIDKEWLIENWICTGKSLCEVARDENVREGMLSYRAGIYGLSKTYKHYFNIEKFKNLKDPHVWYFAGLVATDGSVDDKSDRVAVRLSGESERQLLQSIADYFELKDEIRVYDKVDYQITFAFNCAREYYLNTFNITNVNKTYNVKVPNNIPNEDCAKAYVRGCLDGDGCFPKTSNIKRIRLYCASEDFVKGLINIINTYTNFNVKISYMKSKNRNRQYPGICILGKKSVEFLDWVYSLEPCFKLERKYESYKLMR